MGVSEVLDVAIGVVFVWFLLSIAVSAVNEAISWLTRLRAKQLWRSLAGIVDETVKPQARLRDLFWRVPVGVTDYRPAVPLAAGTDRSALSGKRSTAQAVRGAEEIPEATRDFLARLRDRLGRSIDDTAAGGWRTRISHVPSQLLSDALVGLAEETVTRSSLRAAAERLSVGIDDAWWATLPPRGPVDGAGLGPPPGVTAEQWSAVWAEAERLVTIDDLEAVVAGNPQLATALRRVNEAVAGSDVVVVGARRAIETWFDAEMDSLSRFYRRQTRKVALVIALVLVFVVQADSFTLISELWHDKDLRAVMAGNAALVVDAEVGDPEDFLGLCRQVADLAGDGALPATTLATAAPTATTTPLEGVAAAEARLQCAVELVRGTRRFEFVEPVAIWNEVRDMNDEGRWEAGDPTAWLMDRVPGRLVTAAALVFGAGFWYDALRRLIGLKGRLQQAGGV